MHFVCVYFTHFRGIKYFLKIVFICIFFSILVMIEVKYKFHRVLEKNVAMKIFKILKGRSSRVNKEI